MTQITFESKDFNRALAVVSKAINRRSTFPILNNVLLSRENGQFFLTGSNGDAWGKYRFDNEKVALINGFDFQSICLPADTLRQVLGSFADQRITCDIDEKEQKVTVTHLSGQFSIPVVAANEYPAMPVMDKPDCQFSVDAAWLVSRVKAAKVSVSEDNLRPMMSNVALVVDHEGMDLVGSNGQTLFKDRLQIGVGTDFMDGQPRTVLLHLSVLDIITTAFQNTPTVTIKAISNIVTLESENFTLAFRPIEGKYPNYNAVIPKKQPYKVSVRVASLVAAIKRVAIFASESSNMIELSWDGTKICLDANDIDFGQSASETVEPAEDTSEMPSGFRIGLKAAFLLALLGCVNTETAILTFSEYNRPVVINEEDVNSNLVLLQMPMLLDDAPQQPAK